MSIAITQTLTALGPGLTSSFGASGGTAPYTFSVRQNGAGGSIDPALGTYTAPTTVSLDPMKRYDVIQVTDSSATPLIATAKVLVGTPLHLFIDILVTELGLSDQRVYLYDQKVFQPTDPGLYIAVSVLRNKVFGITNRYDGSSLNSNSDQSVNVMSTLGLDAMSRNTEALFRKEEIIMALTSDYSRSQQDANSFLIGQIPSGAEFVNLSNVDGAAIPYRFHIGVNIQYFVKKTVAVPYFNTFPSPEPTIYVNP